MKQQFIRINVRLLPPVNVADHVKVIRNNLIEQGYVKADPSGLIIQPHITIYAPEYPMHNLAKIRRAFAELNASMKPLAFIFDRISTKRGYIAAAFVLTKKIALFQQRVVNKLNPLREGHIMKQYCHDSIFYQQLSRNERENVQQYGHPDPLNAFQPHISFGKMTGHHTLKTTARAVAWNKNRFTTSDLQLHIMR